MVHVGICDDNRAFRGEVVRLLEAGSFDRRLLVREYHSGLELLQAVEGGERGPDILLLDIGMPHLDGLETARRLRETGGDTVLLFVTRFKRHVFTGYKLRAFDYIVKPLDRAEFLQTVHSALEEAEKHQRNRLHLVCKGASRAVPLQEIVMIESFGNKLAVHLEEGEPMEYYGKLEVLEEQLRGRDFFRTHRSYLVNLEHVRHVEDRSVFLTGDRRAILSRKRVKDFLREWYRLC